MTQLNQSEVEQRGSRSNDVGGKYLTFAVGKEEYGLEILKVREIIGLMDIIAIPRTPASAKGVINLRGQVISVVDLRAKFGMPQTATTDQSCVIVVDVARGDLHQKIGILVDRVSEVLDIPSENIEPAPPFGETTGADFILGMGKIGDTVKILLDIDKVLSAAELSVSKAA